MTNSSSNCANHYAKGFYMNSLRLFVTHFLLLVIVCPLSLCAADPTILITQPSADGETVSRGVISQVIVQTPNQYRLVTESHVSPQFPFQLWKREISMRLFRMLTDGSAVVFDSFKNIHVSKFYFCEDKIESPKNILTFPIC